MQITLERFLVGGICLLPVAGWTLRRKGIRLTRRDVGTFALTGLFCVPLSMVLYQLAITHGQANVVAVLFSGNPIFVTLLAFLLLHETIAWNNLLALVLEVLGIGAIAGLGGQCGQPFQRGTGGAGRPVFRRLRGAGQAADGPDRQPGGHLRAAFSGAVWSWAPFCCWAGRRLEARCLDSWD